MKHAQYGSHETRRELHIARTVGDIVRVPSNIE